MGRGSHGLSESWLLTHGRFKVQTPAPTPEERQKSREGSDALLREQAGKWGVASEDVDLWLSDPEAYSALLDRRKAQARIAGKLVDREARIAVEGDTDTNHDNIEAAE